MDLLSHRPCQLYLYKSWSLMCILHKFSFDFSPLLSIPLSILGFFVILVGCHSLAPLKISTTNMPIFLNISTESKKDLPPVISLRHNNVTSTGIYTSLPNIMKFPISDFDYEGKIVSSASDTQYFIPFYLWQALIHLFGWGL